MDGSASPVSSSSSAPAAAPSAPPAAAPQSSGPPAQAGRAPDGRFAAGERKGRGETRRRILQESQSAPEAPAVELNTEQAEPAPAPQIPQAKTTKAKPQEAAAPTFSADKPESWPEPIRKAHQEIQAEVTQHRETLQKWEQVGRQAVEQNRRLAEEVKFLRSVVEQNGMQIDPRDTELLDYRARAAHERQMQEVGQRREASRQQYEQERMRASIKAEAEAAVSQMASLAKAKGIDIRAIYAEHTGASSLGEKISYEEAASRVMERLEWKQRRVNAGAPTSTTPGAAAGTTLPKSRTREGRMARLRALGHAV
jgi:hypothetical protein